MSCNNCNIELTLTNCSKKQFKRVNLHKKTGICSNCQKNKDDLIQKNKPIKVKKIKGKPRFKFVTSRNVEAAENLVDSQKLASKVAKTINKTNNNSKNNPVLFLDLHNTFDMIINYAKKGTNELNKVLELIKDKSIVIVTFVGWNNKTTEIAVDDIQWSINNLNISCGIVVSERNKKGTTPESQIFTGGKGWIINLLMKNAKNSFYFSDDFEDHIVSVKIMNEKLKDSHQATTLENLKNWIQKL